MEVEVLDYMRIFKGDGSVHLLSAENQTLLDGWDAFLLFYALLYAGHLRFTDVSVWLRLIGGHGLR